MRRMVERCAEGERLDDDDALALAENRDTDSLMAAAAVRRDAVHGAVVSYSRKVFIPLTHLCRDVCHYCTFARPPRRGEAAYMTPDAVLAVARAGAEAGCKEVLFTLGDKPEVRYVAARREIERLGHASTLDYLGALCEQVFGETGLLPHVNAGLMEADDIAMLRRVSVSQGLMLESLSERLCERGGPHFGSPDKAPAARLATMRCAGEARVPFTSGLLIGIGETRRERIETLLALRHAHERFGHIQEVIVQNFRAKPSTRMADATEPDFDDLLWTLAVARLVLGSDMNIQAPPNLSPGPTGRLIDAGINDWGGVSPVTPDFVNPEAPWPNIEALARDTAAHGKVLSERLAVYPSYALDGATWLDANLRAPVLHAIDGSGLARTGEWWPGSGAPIPAADDTPPRRAEPGLEGVLAAAADGADLSEDQVVRLFEARGDDVAKVCAAADALRAQLHGDTVTYVVTRNINYTNVCYFRCGFCAFSKGRLGETLRGRPYDLDMDEIVRRATEAWDRGATEICMQGGIHPDYTGQTYLDICTAVRAALPELHLHAFSPLEIWQGARTLGLEVAAFLRQLRDAGLDSLPGTAAEILDDEVRAVLCPDKIGTAAWLEVMAAAHEVGLRSTATIMFGHVDTPRHWARHLLRVRALQARTHGFTELVPLPFVHMEAPIYLKGLARRGPTWRESLLMHAVARLALHPHVTNIQASWVKMGPEGAVACLHAGANDLGGTLMNETISRAAGADHGQEMAPEPMEALIRGAGRVPRQRTTFYDAAPAERTARAGVAAVLGETVNTPLRVGRDRRRAAARLGA